MMLFKTHRLIEEDSIISSSSSVQPPEKEWDAQVTSIIGFILYSIGFLVIVFNAIYRWKVGKLSVMSLSSLFFICLPFFMALRLAWWIVDMNSTYGLASFWLNRIALCFFLVVFNSVLAYWWDVCNTTLHVSFAKQALHSSLGLSFLSKTAKVVLWTVTSFIISFTLITSLVGTLYYHGKPPGDVPLYQSIMLVLSLSFLGYCLGFIYFGTKLFVRLLNHSTMGLWSLISVEIMAVTLFVCFLLRAVLFSLYIFSGVTLPDSVFHIFCYIIPELVPILVFLYYINSDPVDDDDPFESKSLLSAPIPTAITSVDNDDESSTIPTTTTNNPTTGNNNTDDGIDTTTFPTSPIDRITP